MAESDIDAITLLRCNDVIFYNHEHRPLIMIKNDMVHIKHAYIIGDTHPALVWFKMGLRVLSWWNRIKFWSRRWR